MSTKPTLHEWITQFRPHDYFQVRYVDSITIELTMIYRKKRKVSKRLDTTLMQNTFMDWRWCIAFAIREGRYHLRPHTL
jgi:hypothetical protein